MHRMIGSATSLAALLLFAGALAAEPLSQGPGPTQLAQRVEGDRGGRPEGGRRGEGPGPSQPPAVSPRRDPPPPPQGKSVTITVDRPDVGRQTRGQTDFDRYKHRRPPPPPTVKPVRRYYPDVVHRRGKRHSWGPGIVFWYYDGYYFGDCEWLKRKARATGSPYWWERYRQCRDWD